MHCKLWSDISQDDIPYECTARFAWKDAAGVLPIQLKIEVEDEHRTTGKVFLTSFEAEHLLSQLQTALSRRVCDA